MRSNSIQASTVQGTKTPCLPRIPRMPRICLGYGSSVQSPFKPTLSKMLVNLKCVSTKGCRLFANAKQLFHLVKFSSWLSEAHSQGVAYSQMAPCCTKNPNSQMGAQHRWAYCTKTYSSQGKGHIAACSGYYTTQSCSFLLQFTTGNVVTLALPLT